MGDYWIIFIVTECIELFENVEKIFLSDYKSFTNQLLY